MNLFIKGDILQMRDKSQWEVEDFIYDCTLNEFSYLIRSIQSGQSEMEFERDLNRKAIVIKFANIYPERPKCKIYYLEDYRKKMVG